MRKILSAVMGLVLFTSVSHAQIIKPSVTLGVNVMYSMPQGDLKEVYKYGAGGEIYGGVGWGKTFALATIGYRVYKEQPDLHAPELTVLPVKVGVKQLLFMKRLFVQADGGIANVKVKGGESSSGFTYDFGAGLRFAGVELGMFYDAFKINSADKSSNTLNVKLGYSYSF